MKNQLVLFVAGLAATIASFAQAPNKITAERFDAAQIMSLAASSAPGQPPAATGTVQVNAKVMRIFLHMFSNAADVTWSENNNTYYVTFTQDNKMCKALFNRQGSLLFSLKFGVEGDLPRDVRKLIKSNYIDCTFGVVTQLNTDSLHAWIVNITDSDHLIVVSVHDGELNELHQYETGN